MNWVNCRFLRKKNMSLRNLVLFFRMTKRKNGAWSEEDMERAISAYRNGDMGFNNCCRKYGIPKPTLKRH